MFKQVTDLGRNWARVGLDKGRTALENSADRLRATAELLGTWSSKLSTPVASESAATATTEATVGQPGDDADQATRSQVESVAAN